MTLAAARPIPNLIGETRVGDTVAAISPNNKRVAQFQLLAPTRIAKLTLCCDGGGGAAPTLQARLRGVVYQGGVLLAVGGEVIVTSGDSLRWIDLPMFAGQIGEVGQPADPIYTSYPTGVQAATGPVQLGVLVGGDAAVLRVAQIDPLAPGGATNGDVYVDGPDSPFGVATTLTATMSIFGTITNDWTPDAAVPLSVLARYGFLDAQKYLALGEVLRSPSFTTRASWHGTGVDRNRGSFAVVRAGGAFDGFVGTVLKVTSQTHVTRSVYVYVVAKSSTLDQDLSLSRRAFAALDLLAYDDLPVHVDVVEAVTA